MKFGRRREDDDRQTLEAKTPHFFKVILSETIQDRKLGIPRTFVRKYGEDLTESVQLKVPTGAVWMVELKKCDGNIWFQKGWDKFVESYSIEHGHFLVFRYEGNSKFHVLIFDPSASEIEYPLLNSIHDDEEPTIKKNDSEEVSCDSEEVVQSQRKRKESPPLSCFGPKKMMRTNSTVKSEKASKLDDSKNKGDLHGTMPEFEEAKGCSKSTSKTQRWPKSEVSQRQQSSRADARARALERAKAFKSEHPFYVVSIYPSHLHTYYQVNIPSSFMSTYLTAESGNIILWVSEGRSWSVEYHRFTERNKIRRARISWKAFSQDNCLEVGDACVFEFIQSFEISIKVSIFRAADEANCGNRSKTIRVKPERSSTTKKESGMSGPRNQFAEKEFKLPKDKSTLPGLSYSVHALEATSGFKSEYPFFKAVMHPGYLQHRHLVVPKSFANRYINKSPLTVTLAVADRFWQVKVLKTEHSTRLSAGWSTFAKDNALQSGDVCAFELIERNGDIFKVTIIRFPGLSSTP